MMNGYKNLIAATAMACATMTAAAYADEMNFCEPGTPHCVDAYFYNDASVIVTKVNVKQRANDNGCQAVKKTHKKDMLAIGQSGQKVKMRVLNTCTYHVKFKTTSGCVGNKDGNLTMANLRDGEHGYDTIYLTGQCGILSTAKHYSKYE